MKLVTSWLLFVFVLVAIVGIAVLAGSHMPIPALLGAAAFAALAGHLSGLTLPSITPLVVALVALVAATVLSALSIAIPDVLSALVIGGLTGHFALPSLSSATSQLLAQLDPPASSTTSPAPASTTTETQVTESVSEPAHLLGSGN